MPNVDKKCITHHYACDCREEKMHQIIKNIFEIKRLLFYIFDFPTDPDIKHIQITCNMNEIEKIIKELYPDMKF